MTAIASTTPLTMTGEMVSEQPLVRFGASMVANVVRAALSFASGLLVARGLGASDYGQLAFLLATFAATRELLDGGSSAAFYTLLSRRRRTWVYLGLYFGWLLVQFVVMVTVIGLVLPRSTVSALWVGAVRPDVLLAFAATFVSGQLWRAVEFMGEARRRTVDVQAAAVVLAAVHLVVIAFASFGGWLSVQAVLWLMLVEYIAVMLVVAPKLARANVTASAGPEMATAWTEYMSYCRPLLAYGAVGFAYVFVDRWLLQRFGGSVQQGYFGIAQQLSAASLLLTTSMARVLWKEIAAADERKDQVSADALYGTSMRGLYLAAAWMSCLFIPYSREIVRGLLGAEYEAGWPCLAILLLTPATQTLGQLIGTRFQARGQTRRYAYTNIMMLLGSIPVSYIALAPASGPIPGFDLGAPGLAIKMLGVELVTIHLLQRAIAQAGGPPHQWRYQLSVVATLLAIGFVAKAGGSIAGGWFSETLRMPVTAALGMTMYVGASVALLGIPGGGIGAVRGELATVLHALRSVRRESSETPGLRES